ncbi:MAG TPA: hypothetical protein VFE94_00165 [Candidatus Paceibacterota bacterium]|nr:hypothetical protein [Candidatus Paceibacterota bacterium]
MDTRDLEELLEKARLCVEKNKGIVLPEHTPYLGMGASYYAALTLWFLGKDILPYEAFEYYAYQGKPKEKLGVLISQSGESSELLWNLARFKDVVAITNDAESSLAKAVNAKQVVELYAGKEEFVSIKTYFNTLLVLYLGLGFDPRKVLDAIEKQFSAYRGQAQERAQEIAEYMRGRKLKGLFVLGSGPNAPTAMEGALTLSEATKFAWQGLSPAQYDHGPKETMQDSVVLFLQSNGKDKERIAHLKKLLSAKSNALVREIVVSGVPEELSPFCHIVQLNFLMVFLTKALGVKAEFMGEKITRTPL